MRSAIAAGVGVAVGIWMMVAPAVLGYSGAAATSDRIVGPTAAAAAWIAAARVTRSLRWINLVLGMWVVLSPLVLSYEAPATIHSALSGTVLIVTAVAIGRMPTERFAGGWRALMRDR